MALWLSHNKDFVWKARGFASVEDMNEHIITAYNAVVKPEDDVYVLGDLILGDSEKGIECVKRMNGKFHIVRGNHDTDNRWATYANLPNIIELQNSIYLKYNKHHFYLSHYPSITSNHDYEKPLIQRILNLCGHSHTTDKWQDWDKGYIYHCEIDAHNYYPVNLDDILQDFYIKL